MSQCHSLFNHSDQTFSVGTKDEISKNKKFLVYLTYLTLE